MIRFAWGRLMWAVVTGFIMSIVAFFLVAVAPGDPITAELRFLGVPARPDTVERLRREFDLDAPVAVRYARWLGRVVRVDFGTSIASGRPVAADIGAAVPSTLSLAVLSAFFMMAISVGAGMAGAVRPTGMISRALRGMTVIALSVPLYWLCLATVAVSAVALHWTTVVGDGSASNLIVPALVVAVAPGLAVGRMIRQRIIDERLEDYVRLATVLGRSPWQILVRDIAIVIAPATITIWATSFGYLLGGTVVAERIFDRPGLGNLALQAISARDYPIIQAYLVLTGLMFVAVNWTADVISAWLDPRLRRAAIHE